MRIAVTGSSGMLGTALVAQLRSEGHSVTRVVRSRQTGSSAERLISWDPKRGTIDAAGLENHDAVVHLAGESLLGIWTESKKARIRESRVRGTALLARTIASLKRPPAVLVSASATGYYGHRPGGEPLDETASAGSGFLASVVMEWENAARAAEKAGVRVAFIRSGMMLSPRGGALAVMLPIFQAGIGGRLGNGRHVWSWVTVPDAAGAIMYILSQPGLAGAVNVTAPEAVTNAEFTQTLGRVLHRPTIFVAPAPVMKLVLGEMADEVMWADSRVVPRKLLHAGYPFKHPELEGALRSLLHR